MSKTNTISKAQLQYVIVCHGQQMDFLPGLYTVQPKGNDDKSFNTIFDLHSDTINFNFFNTW